tara:strand:- start:844 stop:2142 length:1299 start_codon:yes stop_codon:yes gene_type:complete
MRYVRDQPIITDLIENRYQLKTQRFDTGDVNQHIYYLRDTYVDVQNWSNAPYSLPDAFKGMSPFSVLDDIIDQVKANQLEGHYTASNQDLIYPFTGGLYQMPLQKVGFAHLIAETTSYETLKFLTDSGEYYAKTINWNAAEAFPYSQSVGYKAKDSLEYWCVSNGFSDLCTHLLEDFLENHGEFQLSMHLRAVSKHQGPEAQYCLQFWDNKNQKYIYILCNQLILALPLQAIKKIIWSSELGNLFYSDTFQNLLTAVRPLPVVRFALLFETPWWHSDFNGLNGHMVTDLPIRHGYYFGSQTPGQYSVFLATIDMHQTDYWLSLLNHKNNSGELPQPLLDELLKQLKLIHQRSDIPNPHKALFYSWSSSHYGAGFHAWNPGYNVVACMQQALHPFVEEKIHFVGEAFSNIQGWVEGAFSTVNVLLDTVFNDSI